MLSGRSGGNTDKLREDKEVPSKDDRMKTK